MRRHLWPAIILVFICPVLCHGAEPTFSEAIGLLSQERTYAESGAALVKQYAPSDIEARRLYADAKGAFDGLIEQLLADLAQNNDPEVSAAFRERIDAAAVKRVAFELFQGGMTIWKEWRGVSTERRKQITTRIEAQRWKPFAEIAPTL